MSKDRTPNGADTRRHASDQGSWRELAADWAIPIVLLAAMALFAVWAWHLFGGEG